MIEGEEKLKKECESFLKLFNEKTTKEQKEKHKKLLLSQLLRGNTDCKKLVENILEK